MAISELLARSFEVDALLARYFQVEINRLWEEDHSTRIPVVIYSFSYGKTAVHVTLFQQYTEAVFETKKATFVKGDVHTRVKGLPEKHTDVLLLQLPPKSGARDSQYLWLPAAPQIVTLILAHEEDLLKQQQSELHAAQQRVAAAQAAVTALRNRLGAEGAS